MHEDLIVEFLVNVFRGKLVLQRAVHVAILAEDDKTFLDLLVVFYDFLAHFLTDSCEIVIDTVFGASLDHLSHLLD